VALPASAADYLALDPDQQADVLLGALATCPENERGRNIIVFTVQRWFPALNGLGPMPAGGFGPMQQQRHAVTEALEEAYAVLESGGDIRPDPSSGRTFCQVTRKGQAKLQATTVPNPRRVTFARLALEHVSLHPALQARHVDDLFRQGKYETALPDGSTYLEDAIRTLGGFTNKDIGTKLCGKAFSATGPLADPGLVAGERDGWQQLYTGFFGAVRNKVAHRSFQYASDKEALTHLVQLDLLVEQLAATAARLGKQLP
jgi:uncharacterized protein (TIGR02391 family)